MVASSASDATRLDLLTDRHTEWRLRMDMVASARRFLVLTSYYFGRDSRGVTMARALARAVRRGVTVVVVVDRFGHRLAKNLGTPRRGTRASHPDPLQIIERAGGRVVRYAPASRVHRLIGGGLHVKIQISEAGVAIFGSSNIAHHSFAQWNEVCLIMEGAVVSHLLHDACGFAGLSSAETGRLGGLLPRTAPAQPVFRLRYLSEDPAGRVRRLFPFAVTDNRLSTELVALIDGARHTVRIASLYCKPVALLRDAIIRACRRGVAVEIFHSHRDSLGVTQVPWISASVQYGAMLAAGARIYENRVGEHAKVVLVDERHVAAGSYNFEHAAHDRLIEAMVFTTEPGICERFSRLFDALRTSPDSTEVRADWLSALPRTLRLRRLLYRPLQRWV